MKQVLVLGGAGAVGASVEDALNSAIGASKVTRLAGSDRFSTAVAVASYGCVKAGLSWDGLAIATGDNFPDALAGGVMQGEAGSVLLLSPQASLHAATRATLVSENAGIASVRYLGGTGALSQTVRDQVSAILQ